MTRHEFREHCTRCRVCGAWMDGGCCPPPEVAPEDHDTDIGDRPMRTFRVSGDKVTRAAFVHEVEADSHASAADLVQHMPNALDAVEPEDEIVIDHISEIDDYGHELD